jgi:hypothetical protein
MQQWRMIFIVSLAAPLSSTWAADAEGEKGFIQIAPSGRYFQWEDGTPFFPIGQNDWPNAFDLRKRSRADLDAYFQNLSTHGVNVLRLLMDVGDKEDVVWVETRPGVFNPAFKTWMDTIVELARPQKRNRTTASGAVSAGL